MDVTPITMPQAQARELYEQYRAAVSKTPNAEDEAIMRGYRALSQGSALLDLHAAMRTAGLDENGMPRLAITRANMRWCYYRLAGLDVPTFVGTTNDLGTFGSPRSYRYNTVALDRDVLPRRGGWPSGRALVPSIPPAHRPTVSLRHFHILWEAEWKAVPTDPFLLRHLGGSLYVVLAQWDLTELERAVLAGRLTE